MNKKRIKNFYIAYLFIVTTIGIFIKYKVSVVEDYELYTAFDNYISKWIISIISIISGCCFYKFGFDNDNFKIIKKIVGYLSFSGGTLFINIIFSFTCLIAFNSINLKKMRVL